MSSESDVLMESDYCETAGFLDLSNLEPVDGEIDSQGLLDWTDQFHGLPVVSTASASDLIFGSESEEEEELEVSNNLITGVTSNRFP